MLKRWRLHGLVQIRVCVSLCVDPTSCTESQSRTALPRRSTQLKTPLGIRQHPADRDTGQHLSQTSKGKQNEVAMQGDHALAYKGSASPDLVQLQLQVRELCKGLQKLDLPEALGLTSGGLHLNNLFVRDQQTAQLGTVGLLGAHPAPKRRQAPWSFIARSSKLDH